MTDEWPNYHTGRRDHLHALGIIALGYSAFERGLVTVYAHHCAQQHMPYELVHLYYSLLKHGKREAAGFLLYLRCRDIPADQLPVGYRVMLYDPISPPLTIPAELKLSPHPEYGAMPDHPKKRKR